MFFIIILLLSNCTTKKHVTKDREKVEIVKSASSVELGEVVVNVDHDIITYRESVITYENNQPVKKTISEKIIDKTKLDSKKTETATSESKSVEQSTKSQIVKDKKTSLNFWGMFSIVGVIMLVILYFTGGLGSILAKIKNLLTKIKF